MAYIEKYASVAGAGAHNGNDAANAWTLAEMLTNIVAGERGNLISGAYSSGADVLTNSGNAAQMIAIRGYNSTIGDLETQGRNADTSLDTTNFPVITVTGILAPSAYSVWQNISITGAVGTFNFGSTGIDHVTLLSSKFLQTGAGVSVLGDNNYSIINCDIESSATTHGDVLSIDVFCHVTGCRIKGAATSGSSSLMSAVGARVIGTAFLGTTSLIGLKLEALGQPWLIENSTFYNCDTAIQLPNSAVIAIPVLVNNHPTDCTKYIDSLYSGTANNIVIEVNNRTRDNTTPRTGIGDGVNVGEVTTDTGGAATDYVDAPNGDITLIAAAPGIDAGMGM